MGAMVAVVGEMGGICQGGGQCAALIQYSVTHKQCVRSQRSDWKQPNECTRSRSKAADAKLECMDSMTGCALPAVWGKVEVQLLSRIYVTNIDMKTGMNLKLRESINLRN